MGRGFTLPFSRYASGAASGRPTQGRARWPVLRAPRTGPRGALVRLVLRRGGAAAMTRRRAHRAGHDPAPPQRFTWASLGGTALPARWARTRPKGSALHSRAVYPVVVVVVRIREVGRERGLQLCSESGWTEHRRVPGKHGSQTESLPGHRTLSGSSTRHEEAAWPASWAA